MNTALYVIIVAIIATTLSMAIQLYYRDREVSPTLRALMWILLIIGIIAFIVTAIIYFTS